MTSRLRGAGHGRDWIGLLLYALAVIMIGLLALLNPFLTGLSIGVMLGLALISYGIIAIVAAFSRRQADWIEALLGLCAIIAGVLTLASPLSGTATLVWMTGAWLVVAGIFSLIAGFSAKVGRLWMIITGLLNLLIGGFLLLMDPVSALAYAAIMLGISFLSRGIFLASTAINLRKALN